MYFNEAKAFAGEYRKEISPIMNKMGFKVSVTTYKEYYDEGKVIIKIIKVPKNFAVWSSEYSRYDFTPQAQKIERAIINRLEGMRDERPEDLAELDYEVMFDRKIPYIPYEELNNEEN
jgi:predicted class III extradiol MEMO1 family dioxygenase|tara:strand:- start:272 stop:625 length:354 start_codon:yes stop_codon:yes gene_type:complete